MSSNWRARRDPRGRNVPDSVASVVRYAQRGLAAAHLGEGLCFGAAFGLITAAAGLASGAERGLELLGLSAGIGGLGFVAYTLAARVPVADLARRIDRSLRFDGGLVTAWEHEREGRDGPLGRLLSERVRKRLRRGDALRSVLPGLALPVGVLLASAGLLLVALIDEPAPPPAVDVARLLGGARASLEQARAEALDQMEAGELDGAEARQWIEALEALDRIEAEASPRALLELDRSLAERAPDAERQPALAEELERARAQLDAARTELERRTTDPEADAARGPGNPELTSGVEDGTMPGSKASGQGSAGAPTDALLTTPPPETKAPSRGAPERAAWAAWWPSEYDELVRGWVDRRR